LTDDCNDGLVVHLRIVKTVQQVNGTRPAGGHADADRAGEFSMSRCHERRKFLVPGLDESRFVSILSQARGDAIDTVAGESVDAFDTPLLHALHSVLADCD
jgi:hypothetical protein